MKILRLHDIQFPLYSITKTYTKIWDEYNVKYISTNNGTYVLDNKNLPGDTVGKRRLHIENSKTYKHRLTITSITQLLKTNYDTFMDTNGNIFKYKKTKFVPLKYYKVNNITKTENNGCIVEFKNINYSIKINCRTAYSIQYIGLLHTDMGLIPYEYTDIKKSDSRRKI